MTPLRLPDAACVTPAARDAFDRVNVNSRPTDRDINAAKAFCYGCPARRTCAAWGLHHAGRGVWGGYSAPELRRMRDQAGIELDEPHNSGHLLRKALL